ncbi:MAG: glycosyltransferase family 39 protein [Kiritimatiellae bacterium]|nr:glycosyltransferase family 39 protein [Kiritimatiellia bacterium]
MEQTTRGHGSETGQSLRCGNPSEGFPHPAHPCKRMHFPRVFFHLALVLIALTCWGRNAWKLHNLEQGGFRIGQEAFRHGGPDWKYYIANAEALGTDIPFVNMFKERPLLPVLFRLAGATRENPYPYLRLAQTMHFFFPLVLAAVSWTLFGNRFFALLSAFSYLFADTSGSLMVMTDFLHAFLFVVSMWTTCEYLKKNSWRWMLLSIAAWDCCMLSRPTFLWVGLMLFPLTSWGKKTWKERGKGCVVHTGLLLAIPAVLTIHNLHAYGVATPTFNAVDNIHAVLIPGIRTTIRKRTEIDVNSARIWHEERDLKACKDENYAKLGLLEAFVPEDPRQFREAYRMVKAADREVVLSNLDVLWELMVSECERMLLMVPPENERATHIRCAFVMAALCGLILAWRNRGNRTSVCATVLCSGWIVASACTFLWTEQRFFWPVLFLMVPFAVSVLGNWKHVGMVAVGLVAYKASNMLLYRPLAGLAVAMSAMVACEFACTLWRQRAPETSRQTP